MNVCRLCGENKNSLDLSIELTDKTSSNWIYSDLIEHHTRVNLKANKLLPQSVCDPCRGIVESFAEFSQHIQTVQDSFVVEEDEQEAAVFELQPIVELFPETIVKELQETGESSSDSESDSENDGEKKVKKSFKVPFDFVINFVNFRKQLRRRIKTV